MKKLLQLTVLLMLVCGFAGRSQAEIATLDQNLRLDIPCISYAGQYYHLTLDYAGSGLLWKYRQHAAMTGNGQPQFPDTCASADQNLTLTIPYLYYMGYEFSVTMTLYRNPADPAGIYWQISNYQLFPAYITAVNGGGNCLEDMLLNNPANVQAMTQFAQCMAACGTDVQCMNNCASYLPAGLAENFGTFQISVQFANTSGSDQVFIIPAGAYFCPPNAQIQPMLILQDKKIVVSAAEPARWYCLPSFCANLDAEAPDAGDIYTICGMVLNPCMRAVVDQARGKSLTGSQKSAAQNDIWDCPLQQQ